MHPMSTECADSIGVLGDGYWECIVQLRDRLPNDPCPQKCNEVFALVHGSVCTAREVTYLPNAIGVFLAESGVQAAVAGDICYGDCLSRATPTSPDIKRCKCADEALKFCLIGRSRGALADRPGEARPGVLGLP